MPGPRRDPEPQVNGAIPHTVCLAYGTQQGHSQARAASLEGQGDVNSPVRPTRSLDVLAVRQKLQFYWPNQHGGCYILLVRHPLHGQHVQYNPHLLDRATGVPSRASKPDVLNQSLLLIKEHGRDPRRANNSHSLHAHDVLDRGLQYLFRRDLAVPITSSCRLPAHQLRNWLRLLHFCNVQVGPGRDELSAALFNPHIAFRRLLRE